MDEETVIKIKKIKKLIQYSEEFLYHFYQNTK